MMTNEQIEKFWSKVDVKGSNDCWEWKGAIQSKGYGSISLDGKTYNAHRVSWMIAHSRMPRPDLQILHSCDNRRCVNPAHLREGTNLENVRDMHRRGRANMTGLLYVGDHLPKSRTVVKLGVRESVDMRV